MAISPGLGVPLGMLLIRDAAVPEAEVDRALVDQAQTGTRLGEILLERGLVSRPSLDRALARQRGVALEAERGFGTGLRGLIERRHLERLGVPGSLAENDGLALCPEPAERRRGERRGRSDRRTSR